MSVSLTSWSIVILAVSISLVLADSNTTCPAWFYFSNSTNQCECTGIEDMISCNQERTMAMIANGVCVTSITDGFDVLAGECQLRYIENNTDRMWSELLSSPEVLNEAMCGPYNREGLLCGRCIEGYGLPAYSSDLKCVNCSVFSHKLSICLYLLIEFVPITLFFVCVIIFRFNITAGPLLGYFLFCLFYYQETIGLNRHVFDYIKANSSYQIKCIFLVSQTISELWNLLFFKSLFPPFCVSEHLNSIHLRILTLVPATYSVLFFLTLCVLVELHARNKVIHLIGKPFIFIRQRLNLSIDSDSIIHAFATCIFLSTTTIACNVTSLTVMAWQPSTPMLTRLFWMCITLILLYCISVKLLCPWWQSQFHACFWC